jgi:hypothetical protein
MKVKIINSKDYSTLEDKVNAWMDKIKLKPENIFKIFHSETNDDVNITIFYTK